MNERNCEVVIVGAGASGLSAGRELSRAGVDVLILEAQDRVGGRTWSRTLANGATIDLGGQWVGPTQTRVLALAEEFQLRTFPTYISGDRISYVEGRAFRSAENFVTDDEAVIADVRQAREKIDSLAASVPLETPWTHPDAAELDRLTYAQWVDQTLTTERGRWQMKYIGPSLFSVDASELSMLHVAFYFASGGGFQPLTATRGGAQESRLELGMQQISVGLARQLGERVLLRQVVHRIVQNDAGAEVLTDELRVRAERVIVALPPALAGRLRYSPALPPARDLLTQRMPMGTAIKMMLVYDTPFWREDGLSGFAVTDRDIPQLIYDNSPEDGASGILVGFTEGFPARKWITESRQLRESEAIQTAIGCFGPKAANLREFVELSWMEQEFARGCYAGIMPPGAWTSFGAALREPAGRIHWAGTETATVWSGYVEGALQSGERVAAGVTARLTKRAGKAQALNAQ